MIDPFTANWFKSSYSSSSGGECVEAAHLDGIVALRDSKLGAGSPVLVFEAGAWDVFTAAVRSGRFDRG
ncbi:DUF397 domain-containing protein [Nocardia sp. NPDC005978]|uniref:DUF397 domain-containing protein n=1 Tax=Nocardia sp. NPDC005978 TaxID=3156725 RepID=UPI0033A6E77C